MRLPLDKISEYLGDQQGPLLAGRDGCWGAQSDGRRVRRGGRETDHPPREHAVRSRPRPRPSALRGELGVHCIVSNC